MFTGVCNISFQRQVRVVGQREVTKLYIGESFSCGKTIGIADDCSFATGNGLSMILLQQILI